MSTLIYSPKVTIRIHSTKTGKTVDVSDDVQSGSVTRTLGPSISTADFTLLNRGHKYEGMFTPMDRVVIYMRRVKSMLVFSGYLDDVPLWSALPNSLSFRASCTLKILQNFYWDPGTPQAQALFNEDSGRRDMQDGGLALHAINLMTTVVGWSKERIHIAAVPDDWFARLEKLADQMVSESDLARMALEVGSSSFLGGTSPSVGTFSKITGIGPGTGTLPATRGAISSFGGPGGGAYGEMALTGESGTSPRDEWYCAMRWPYVTEEGKPKKGVDVGAAKAWWMDRRIMVVSPRTGKAVVLRAADWGPHINTNRVIDVSPAALNALGIDTDEVVHISFAEESGKTAPLGVVNLAAAQDATGDGISIQSQNAGSPGVVKTGWGAPGDGRNMRTITVEGFTITVHHQAVDKFAGFITDLVNVLGYKPKTIYGYNARKIAGSSTWSNHAYGAAIDIDPDDNPRVAVGTAPYTLPKPPKIIQYARKWGLKWGGEYQNSKDYMHFEVLGAPSTGSYDTSIKPPAGAAQPGTDVASQGQGAATRKWVSPIEKPWHISAHFGDGGSHWANGHSGTDFSNYGAGARIRPVGPGVVHASGFDASAYGNHITIDHGKGVYTFYAHMQGPTLLEVGDRVDIDGTLGYVGETGNTSGPHVHLELRLDADTYDAALKSGGIEKYIVGDLAPPRGVGGSTLSPDVAAVTGGTADGTTGGALTAPDLSNIGGGLFNVFDWYMHSADDVASLILQGNRALMNDRPVNSSIHTYMSAGQRDYCSAPNGDFIAWFPDYFGHYKTAGKMIVQPIEIDISSPPSIRWSDRALKTHQFVLGSISGVSGGIPPIVEQYQTAGLASVELPELMKAILNIDDEEASSLASAVLSRYGARPNSTSVPEITGPRQEFFMAVKEFSTNWAQQWRTSINITFMPEMYPGMLAVFPSYGIQGYVREVTHSFDMTGGFRTTVSAAPWSSIGKKGPGAMVKGAPL